MNLVIRLIFLAGAIGIAAFAIGYRYVVLQMNAPLELHEPVSIELKRGQNIYDVAKQLRYLGVIEHDRPFVYYARYMDVATKIKAGEYQLKSPLTLHQLLEKLVEGSVTQYSVTLVEGHTAKEYFAKLAQENKLNITETELELLNDEQALMKKIGSAGVHPEGQFFPDTYFFTKGDSAVGLLQRAHQQMLAVLEEEWPNRAKGLPYETPYEALIMASIIEKETGVESERADIAGVFVRRLQKGMRLQTDPTVIYGMGDSYNGNIRRKHLKQKTPYNTYVIKGLPPTPIANPGREAVYAALHPAPGKSLYFVAKGDGSHVFSATLEEHNKAVRQYQLKRRADYRSAPIEK